MNTDNTQGGAEPSPASGGSQPVGWGAVASDGSVVCMMRRRADVASYVVDGTPIVPLYRSPPLTDEEREAIERLCEAVTEYSEIDRKGNGCHADDDMAAVAVARGLMKRMV
jgi:hypothetical protein